MRSARDRKLELVDVDGPKPRSSATPAAERQRRSRARKEYQAEGYLLLNDVPLAPETLANYVVAGVIPAELAERPRKLSLAIGGLLVLYSRPRVAKALSAELNRLRDELGLAAQVTE